MAVEAEVVGSINLELEGEVEGNQVGTKNYRFLRIGEPVPIVSSKSSTDDSVVFDSKYPPSQPLAISHRFRLLFLAHPHGFCVARTKDVMTLAEEIKEKSSGSCVQELSLLDVHAGKVSILGLSADDSTLAASVGTNLHFFSLSALLHKEHRPSFSLSLNESSSIRDMRWTRRLEKSYVVLSSSGKLYHGTGQGPLKYVVDNVDAVEWHAKGNFVAVARKNILSILSSKFKERLSMSLSFRSLIGDSNPNCTVKVDSISWVRADCIILGCFQIADKGEAENYFIQVITSKEGNITDISSKPIVLSFNDVFLGFNPDLLTSNEGSHMFLSYLNQCELAFIGNRMNTDQHIVLLGWSVDNENNEAAIVEILNDAWLARIDPQGNDDDNFILGLCLDKVSQNENILLKLGDEEKEVSPCCILFCMSVDGKLSMFHFASATGSDQSRVISTFSDEEEDTSAISSECELPKIHVGVEEESTEQGVLRLESLEVTSAEHRGVDDCMKNDQKDPVIQKHSTDSLSASKLSVERSATCNQEVKPVLQTLKSDEQQKHSVTEVNLERSGKKSLFSSQQGTKFEGSSLKTSLLDAPTPLVRDNRKTETQPLDEVGSNAGSGKLLTNLSSSSLQKNLQNRYDMDFPEKRGSTNSQRSLSQSWSSGQLVSSKTFDGGSSFLSFGNDSSRSFHAPHSMGVLPHSHSYLKETAGPSTSVNSSRHRTTPGSGHNDSLPVHTYPLPFQENLGSDKNLSHNFQSSKENYRGASSARRLVSEPNLSKQFRNVEEMVKELDALLDSIEGEGGFKDASITFQKNSVVALEEGMWTLSDRCRELKGVMEERLKEIQFLLDKTIQVLARKLHVEGIAKQATDGQYWDLWNRQKLGSELELKQRHILEVNQVLTNQLIELERHFNSLELNRFGEKDRPQMNRKAFQSKRGPSRHFESLHSLCSTTNAQLAAAEQLSECLSKQMATLSINSASFKNQKVKKELFETIGITYDGLAFSSPVGEKVGTTPPDTNLLASLCSATTKQFRRNQSIMGNSSEPETVRRRRESLDRSWASFEPSKTTVKRILLQDSQRASARRPSFSMDKQHLDYTSPKRSATAYPVHHITPSAVPSKHEGFQEILTKPSSKSSSSLFQWDADDLSQAVDLDSSAEQKIQRKSSAFLSEFTSNVGSTGSTSHAGKTSDFTAERSSSVTLTEKAAVFAVRKSESIQYSESHLHQTPVSVRSFSQTSALSKVSAEISNAKDNDVALTNAAVGNIKHWPTMAKDTTLEPGKSLVSAFDSASALSGRVFHSEIAKNKMQTGEMAASTTISALSAQSSSSPQPSATTSSSSAVSFGVSVTSFKPHIDANCTVLSSQSTVGGSTASSKANFDSDQMLSLSQSTASSSSNISSATYQNNEKLKPLSFSAPIINSASKSPNTETQSLFVESNLKIDENSMKLASNNEFNQKTVDNSTQQYPSPQPEPPAVNSTLELQPSVPPTQSESGPLPSSKSESRLSFNDIASSTSNVVHFKTDQLAGLGIVPSFALSSSGSVTSEKNESVDVTNVQEDEMEEEAPEIAQTTELALGNLGGFGIGSSPQITAVKPNPFGPTFGSTAANSSSASFTMTVPSGELFRPASFSFQSLQGSQQSQPPNAGAFSVGGTSPIASGSGFGQPAQIGAGQQALGSVLGTFGQSRQMGAGVQESGIASLSGFNSGFANAATGAGFASLASASGGFAAAATGSGGFAAAAAGNGGFAAAAGGFAAAATVGPGFVRPVSGGGFPAAGGFGSFSNQQASGGFSAFSSSAATGRPPSELFTQMRK